MKPLLSLTALAFTLIAGDTLADGPHAAFLTQLGYAEANSQQLAPHDPQEPIQAPSAGTGMPMTGNMDPAMMQQMMTDMMSSPSDAASTREFKEAQMAMMLDMRAGFTGDPDVDFRTRMIPHHQAAIDMAKIALKHAKNEDTKRLARMIIEAQEKEIAEMREWLKKRGK
jgi:uncharacterized protein (DUF305 family)